MDHFAGIPLGDLHRRMLGAGRGPADQERKVHAQSLHFAGHVDHFLQAGRDQPAQPDMSALLSRAVLRIFSQGTITPRSMIL